MPVLKTAVVAFGVLMALGLCGALELHAHPFHTTTAEMEYNAQSKRFEVALKVPAADLEEALTRQALLAGKQRSLATGSLNTQTAGGAMRVKLDSTPDVERLIIAYLKTHFFLKSSDRAVEPTFSSDVARTPEGLANDEKQTQVAQKQSRSSEERSTLHWVGIELDRSSAWLYFELQPCACDRLSLVSELFFELNSQQINTCTLRMQATRFSLRTDARQPQVALPPQAPTR